jgi:cyclic pyranopterin phosphate synthase
MPTPKLTHMGDDGARMVDVSDKPVSRRRAVAEGCVRISPRLAEAIRGARVPKGNLLEVARIAGIQAAKQADRLIPLCHSLPLDFVDVQITVEDEAVTIRSEVVTTSRTGVEMEAFTAVSVAALTVVDMGKAVDREMVIDRIRLIEKSGGRSGDYRREGES